MNAKTIDTDTFTITFERHLDATPERVFDAWTLADEIAAWWDPDGVPLTRCEIDLRVGGTFVFANAGHGPPFAGVYRVVDRPRLLGFDALGSTGTVTLTAVGEATHMKVEIKCASADHLQQFVKLGVDTGTGRTLDNLVARLAPPAATPHAAG